MDPETATIVSGFLSMAGGFAGAYFAFKAANKTMKEQKTISDNEIQKNLELKNLESLLENLIEIKYLIDVSYTKRDNTETRIRMGYDENYTSFSGESLVNEQLNLKSVQEDLKRIDYLMQISKSKWNIFCSELDVKELLENSLIYISETMKFNLLFLNKNTIKSSSIRDDFYKSTINVHLAKENFKKSLSENITEIESKMIENAKPK